VTPYDGTDAGTAVTSAAATAANTPPVVTSVSLTTSAVRTNDTLTANAVTTDADADTVTLAYLWSVNGTAVSGATTSSLSGATSFQKGDVVGVTVIPNDGASSGTAVASSTVTVLDTAPTEPGVALRPEVPELGEGLTCSVGSPGTDDDGDAITYDFEWEREGVGYTAALHSATMSTVSGTAVSAGETWLCSIRSRAGGLTSEWATDEVTVTSGCDTGAVTHTASGVDFVSVCAQTFQMGCTPGAAPCQIDEILHNVTLTHTYNMGQTEVTQAEFGAVMGYNPSTLGTCGDDCPVENVTWHESAAYANAVSRAAGLASCYTCTGSGTSVTCTTSANPYTCEGYRLATEAEWEAAARCGTDLTYAGSNTIGLVGWYVVNAVGLKHAVAEKYPNGCGLYDMTGNVWEWTHDGYGTYGGTTTDPTGAVSGSGRVLRGGSSNLQAEYTRVSYRNWDLATNRDGLRGLRLARTTP
jgi:formylglycine-generating enzyme required for sulfatase activity